jgi:hypothetical protein
MTRDTEASLLQFCAAQRGGFDPDQWLACPHADRSELTAAALFLAGVDWYGHRAELLRVAENLTPHSTGRLSTLVSRTGFDLSRFSNMLRRRLEYAPAAS